MTSLNLTVEYPATKTVPSWVAQVPASDVREPRRVVPAPSSAPSGAALPAKRPPPESERGAGGCKKVKRTGPGIPMDALRRHMEKEAAAKAHTDAELAPKRQPETEDALFFNALMFSFLFSGSCFSFSLLATCLEFSMPNWQQFNPLEVRFM